MRTNELDELQELLTIDEEDLPAEWHQQPKLYTQIARYAARCHAAQAESELTIKIIEANLDETIRNRKHEKRLTERAIELEIHRQLEWQSAQEQRIARLEIMEIAEALQKAAEMRERSLIRLSQRHLGGNLEDDERLMTIVNKIVRQQLHNLTRGNRYVQNSSGPHAATS